LAEWLANNIPLISGVGVALLSFLTSFASFLGGREGTDKQVKRIKEYATIYSMLPKDSIAKGNIEQLLDALTQKAMEQVSRKVNSSMIAAMIFSAVVGGLISFLLARWAMNAFALWSILLWILFTLIALFTISLSIIGWTLRFSGSKSSKKLHLPDFARF